MNLREHFQNDVASSAFQRIDGELRIIGKYGQVSIVDDLFDIWLIGPNFSSLSIRKIHAIRKKLPVDCDFRELTGEAYVQLRDVDVVRLILPFLGIKKRQKRSSETIKAQTKRLAQYRRRLVA